MSLGRVVAALVLLAVSAVLTATPLVSDLPAVTTDVVSNNDPSVKGTFAWWREKMNNNTKEFDDTDDHCQCNCLVVNPTDQLPFDCTCKCAKPVQGHRGETGTPGALGKVGALGADGRRGTIGPSGEPGIPGTVGDKGMKGYKGDHGRGGDDGIDGRPLPGLQGEKGLPGKARRGPEGPVGPKGPTGRRGDQGDKGTPVLGPRGLDGIVGRQGDKGAKGAKGDTGPRGPEGPRGPMGPPGEVEPTWKNTGLFAESLGQAACLSIQKNAGWVSAVTRDCSESVPCSQICAGIKTLDKIDQAQGGSQFECYDALKLDAETPSKWYSFGACEDKHCGPNICCCYKKS